MSQRALPRLMLAAAASGAGKTTVTCGVLRALSRRSTRLAAFKCGPDYIDPMFHTRVIGIPSRNLDLFFTDPARTCALLAQSSASADLAVIEGVMGFYDGLAGKSTEASSYDLARVTGTPVVLVVDCKGMSVSIAAQIKGFLGFRPDANIQGVLLNRMSPMLYPAAKELIERECGVRVAGYLPVLPQCALESRHLGLVTAGEITDLRERLDVLADAMEQTVDFDLLEAIAAAAPPLLFDPILLEPVGREIPIAVADDPAFCFYYRDSLDLLERLGARLIPFSPLSDAAPPPEACGLLLGGGYPELYAPQLSENLPMRRQLAAAVSGGLPTIAECGGFLYLHRRLQTDRGDWFEMAGVLPGDGFPTGKLSRFGYVTLTAQANGMLCDAGGQIRAHEFHYWDSTACGDAFLAQKPLRTVGWRCAHTSGSLYAGFPHVYFYSNIAFAQRFVTQCARFGQKRP